MWIKRNEYTPRIQGSIFKDEQFCYRSENFNNELNFNWLYKQFCKFWT